VTVLPTQDYTTIDDNMVTVTQGASTQPLTLTIGSVLRAIIQAVAGMMIWLQGMILQVQALTRAATSTGSDLDSWMADFDFVRLGAVAGSTTETFGRYTATNQAVIYVGTTIQTGDGTVTFMVIEDALNAYWNAGYSGYVMPINTTSIGVPVVCTVAGAIGNVLIGSISVITTPIPGIDYCTNADEVTNGENPESDAAFRARFVLYINGLDGGTYDAVLASILAVRTGLFCSLVENEVYPATPTLGSFFAVIDDGSGSPPMSLVSEVEAAIDLSRPLCSIFSVQTPSILMVAVAGTITVANGYISATVVTNVTDALETYLNTLPDGATLYYTSIFPIIYGVAGVIDAYSFTLNAATTDIVPSTYQVIKSNGTPAITT